MVKKQKFLKNLLASVSVASIVASIGGSSVAFGVDVGAGAGAKDLSVIWAGAAAGDWLVFNDTTGILTVDVAAPGQIFGINVANKPAGNTIINNNITIGSIIGDAVMDTTINEVTLTLDGNGGLNPGGGENPKNDYRALGNVVLNHADSALIVQPADNPVGTAGNIVLHGNITTATDGKGTLTFKGAGTVKEAIGTDVLALAEINIGDAAIGGDVVLEKDVFTKKLNFVTNHEVTIAGNFTGGIGAGEGVDFTLGGGTLTFNSAADTTFTSAIVNGNHGILNVQTNLTATNADIGKIKTINIGTAAGGGASKPGILAINASGADVAFLDETAAGAGPDAAINFLDKKSTLKLYIEGVDDRTITFHKDLPGFNAVDGGGIVLLQGTGDNTLIVQSEGGTKTLGTAGRKLDELQVRGRVTIRGVDAAIVFVRRGDVNEISLKNARVLNVINGAIFLDESLTSQRITEIHIGASNGIDFGRANYILDTDYHNFGILEDSTILFDHPDAQLTLRNSDVVSNNFITFYGNLSGIETVAGGGIVLLQSIGDKTLTVRSDDGTRTLGEKEKKLQELQVRGNVVIAGMDAAAAAVAAGGVVTNRLDVSNANKLSVINGAVFTDESATSAQIAEIHIGAASTDATGAAIVAIPIGKANYILDAKYGNFGILAPGKSIIFDAADAQLTLRNSSDAEDRIITFHDDLAGFSKAVPLPAIVNGGIVSLESTNGKTLFVESAGGVKTLGKTGAKLDELQVRGQVTIKVGNRGVNVVNVSNANKLSVISGAVFTDGTASSAGIADVHIGAADGPLPAVAGKATYILDTKYGKFNILAAKIGGVGNNNITFDHPEAQLTLRNSAEVNRTITFHNSLEGFKSVVNGAIVEHGGIVLLQGTNDKTLTLKSNVAMKTLGTVDHNIGQLQVRGKVMIRGEVANKLDISNALRLNVINGAEFNDASATSARIAEINIGADDGIAPAKGGGVGPADYIIDAAYNGFTILADAAHKINFLHADANLILRNSADEHKTIILANSLDPGANVDDLEVGKGIVQLHSVHATKTLTINAGGGGVESLGVKKNYLKELIITGTQVVIEPVIYAKTITLDVEQLTTRRGGVHGNIEFLADTVVTAGGSIGNVDFHATVGRILLANGRIIGTVKGDGNNGTLVFAGAGRAEAIDGLAAVIFNGAGVVNLGPASATIFNINHANAKVITTGTSPLNGRVVFTAAGQLSAGNNVTGVVDFTAGGGTLTFHGGGITTFSSTIASGDQGTLNVRANLIATNADIGKIHTINIGTNAANQILTINASVGNVKLLDHVEAGVGATINFEHANSRLGLYTKDHDRSIIFHDDLPGRVASGGRVLMQGENSVLTLQSIDGTKTLGIPAQKLNEIMVAGKVTIVGDAHKLDIRNTNILNIVNDGTGGTIFTDEYGTSAQIATINIGTTRGVLVGPATYVLDAKYNNIDILTDVTHKINFLHADSKLTLRNSDNDDKTITLANSLVPANAKEGIVEFNSVVVGKVLTIVGAGQSLDTKAASLKEIIFSGDGLFNIDPNLTLYTESIGLNVPEMRLGNVNSNIIFVQDGTFHADGNITGYVDFKNYIGIVNLANTKNITGHVTSSGGINGTLQFLGSGSVGGLITNLKMLKAGAGNVALLAAGNHSITEIQGSGMQNLTFADGFNLTGGINLTGGQAVNLVFLGNGQVSGSIGTPGNSVGNIQIQAGTVTFGDLINAQKIDISGGAIAEIVENMAAQEIKGQGTVKFNNENALVIDSEISIDNIEIAKGGVEVKKVSGGTVRFTNSQEAILTLKEESIINSITTIGDNSHSLALNANLSIAGDVGADGNRLKEIKLLGDHTLSIASNNFYSDVSTATNNSGKVIFNSDSVAYGKLGTDEFRLSEVTFDSDSTVKADVYSKKIVINADKTASFAGTDTREISIPGVPRLLEKFTYSTEIVSEEINAEASSKIKFDNATLVRAPINGGQVISADDVWFKEKVDSTGSIAFAPDKYVILENDIKFSSIEASQAKIIVLAEKETITGNLTAKDLTIDLGTGQLKYSGDAKLTGELKLYSFYDSSKSAGGNIEIQSDSKLDVSQLDKLHIIIAGRTDINKISDDTKYTLISSVDGNGVSALDLSKITLDSVSEQNRFVSWTIDPSSLTLHAKNVSPDAEGTSSDAEGTSSDTKDTSSDAKDISLHPKNISKEVLEKDFANESSEDKQLVKQLLEAAAADPSCDAAKFTDNVGNMEKDDAKQAFDRLLSSGGGSPVGESLENPIFEIIGTMVMDIANQFTSQITSRSVNMHTPGVPIGSGDDDKIMYGVWGSPFYSIANQKIRKGVSGYKLKSAGGIVGFDSLINDDLLVGVAYSRIDTKVSYKDQKIGDKTSGETNVFSLYGLYKFPANWFAEAIASYGITNVKNLEGRVFSTDVRKVTTLGTAVAKYKSISYSGQLLAGYSYQPSEKLIITPTIGFRYSQFTDSGYTETGAAYQSLIVKKRSYNKFEGIFGLRTATNIKLDQVLLIPEVHGYVNYDFKGKTPIIDARLGGIAEPLPIRSVKPAKLSFTVGTGLTVKSNMMEYGVVYNAHIANKYIGHQGSLKVKVNF